MGLVGMALGALYSARPGVLMTPQAVREAAGRVAAGDRRAIAATVSFAPNFAYDLCVRRVKDRDLEGLDLSSLARRRLRRRADPRADARGVRREVRAGRISRDELLPELRAGRARARGDVSAARRAAARRSSLSAEIWPSGAWRPLGRRRAERVTLVSCGRRFPATRSGSSERMAGRCPTAQVGEIALAGPSVMLGYYKQDALTAQTIRDGWLHTGDLGYLSDGELFVCGRVKDIIIVNGRKYHPQDLEWAVDDLPGVRRGRVVAFGTTEPGRPDRVVIVVEPSGTVPADALTDAIRRRIGDVFGLYVDEVVLVPSGTVGRTTSGKVQRAATKARYERGELVRRSG